MWKATKSTGLTYPSMLAGCDDTEGKATLHCSIEVITTSGAIPEQKNAYDFSWHK